MNVILDSCSIFNIVNGEILDEVLNLKNFHFYITSIVYSIECSTDYQKSVIENAVKSNKLICLEDTISPDDFIGLKLKYQLGDGETESIALSKKNGLNFSSDDRKARMCAKIELGKEHIIGSLYLIRETVRQGLLDCSSALTAFTIIKAKGGFLPDITVDYLCR